MQQNLPFASKSLADGRRLFRRLHGSTLTLAASGDTVFSYTIPYATVKINAAEILWCPEGVTVDFKVKDNASGTYSGVPNYTLNQFGFGVTVSQDYYQDHSEYEADLFAGMVIEFTFHNSTATTKTIGVNLTLHEVAAAP